MLFVVELALGGLLVVMIATPFFVLSFFAVDVFKDGTDECAAVCTGEPAPVVKKNNSMFVQKLLGS